MDMRQQPTAVTPEGRPQTCFHFAADLPQPPGVQSGGAISKLENSKPGETVQPTSV
jgi:hypothetical protein